LIHANSSYDAGIEVWNAINSGGEAQIIARMIKRLITENPNTRYKDIAVLYRMNSQCLPLQIALCLEGDGIPFYCRQQDNIIMTQTMDDLLSIVNTHIQLKKDPSYNNPESTKSILCGYFHYIENHRIDQFHRIVKSNNGYKDIIANPSKYINMLGNLYGSVHFVDAIKMLYTSYSTADKCISEISTHYKNLGGIIGNLDDALSNALPLGEFVEIASRFKGNIEQFYKLLFSIRKKIQEGLYSSKEEGDVVSLITYFKAKGRQWNTVFLPGVNQKVIPSSRADIEVERRLFYVAITRVKSNLFISYVRNAVGENVDPSQFIFELGLEKGQEKRATFINKN
jgi:DNA helicase-2/ATP-dependent DNA helicase PcrA